jgi:hypothetical protein
MLPNENTAQQKNMYGVTPAHLPIFSSGLNMYEGVDEPRTIHTGHYIVRVRRKRSIGFIGCLTA